MEKTVVQVPGLWDSRANGYSQCVTAGGLVFIAGQVGTTEDHVVSEDFETQIRQLWSNMQRALEAGGSDLDHLVHTTTHLSDLSYARQFMEIRIDVLGKDFPTSAVLGGAEFIRPGVYAEMQAIGIRKTT